MSPRIVVSEYNSLFGPAAKVSIPYRSDFYRRAGTTRRAFRNMIMASTIWPDREATARSRATAQATRVLCRTTAGPARTPVSREDAYVVAGTGRPFEHGGRGTAEVCRGAAPPSLSFHLDVVTGPRCRSRDRSRKGLRHGEMLP